MGKTVKYRIAVGVALFAVVATALFCAAFRRGASAMPEACSTEGRVRLASRSIPVPPFARRFPSSFAELQSPSARGTAPYVVVAADRVSRSLRERAAAAGARVISYIPDNAMLVEVSAEALDALSRDPAFRSAHELRPSDKIEPALAAEVERGGMVQVTVVPLASEDIPGLMAFAEAAGGEPVGYMPEKKRLLRTKVPASTVADMVARGDVRWVERCRRPRLFNNVAVNSNLMNVREVWNAHGLTGAGQIVVTSDSGLDKGRTTDILPDFTNRVCAIRPAYADACRTDDIDGHGTHTAGSIAGDGSLSDGEIRGVAYGARLWVWACQGNDGYLYIPDYSTLFMPDMLANPAYLHSASWGGEMYTYSADCEEVDRVLWRHPDILAVFAAGNDGQKGAGTIADPAGAKNVLAVGAAESDRPDYKAILGDADNPAHVMSFSSKGPMPDGRIKPDVCAPGTAIVSVRSSLVDQNLGYGAYSANTNYVYMRGTSMATPLVAGSAALVRQWLVERRGFTNALPTAALMKAIIAGGARDLNAEPNAICDGAAPNNAQGWGRVNVGESLYPSNRAVRLVDRIPFTDGEEYVVRVTTTNAAPFDVQLAWIDSPGDPAAAAALVNDLDLIVSNETTGAVWLGNGGLSADRVNSMESVRIAASDAPAGTYCVIVRGANVPYDWQEGGAAAVYIRGAFEGEPEVYTPVVQKDDVLLRRYSWMESLGGWWDCEESLHARGSEVVIAVPGDAPDGAEEVDLTGEGFTYDEGDVTNKTATIQRLGGMAVGGTDEDAEYVFDASGRMPSSISLTMDAGRDVFFVYWDVASTNASAGLPSWWHARYLMGRGGVGDGAEDDADGDGIANGSEFEADTDPTDPGSAFRIIEFTGTNIVWTGGRERTQVLEAADALCVGEAWTGVLTNSPPTSVTNSASVPEASGSSGRFYRIRAF